MTQQDTQEELWSDIFEFPGYSISNLGRVRNEATGFHIKASRNTHGALMVGLMKNAQQSKRSLALLVARGYLSRPQSEQFDTPIHLDGDRGNCRYDNLIWRPLWFARKYMRQFTDGHSTYTEPIEDVETGELYESSMHASMANGVLDNEIYLAMMNNSYVWPTGQVFRKVLHR